MKKTETGNHAGVFILPAIAFLISIGFFVCVFVVLRIVHINMRILRVLRMETEKNWEKVMVDLQDNIGSLGLNFFVTISIYFFLKAILCIILSKEQQNADTHPSILVTYLKQNIVSIKLILRRDLAKKRLSS